MVGSPEVASTHLAAIQADVLVRSFAIALVVVTPLWLHRRRRARRAEGPPPDSTTTDDSVATPDPRPRLEAVIADVERAATSAAVEGTATLDVPTDLTIDGAPIDTGTADVLIRDALRRSGLVAVTETSTPAGRTIECRPIDPTHP